MEDDLPEEVDLIVIGTGFPESCIAAAASRIGKTVLHIDPNDFYGGSWASFNLVNFCEFIINAKRTNKEVTNGRFLWHISEEDDLKRTETVAQDDQISRTINESKELWTKSNLLEQSRRFNIDLCPKLLYSGGRLVELLVSSNICRYAEFRSIDRVCTRFQDEILNVPCSRSDVFNTKHLSIVEKRLLMKFLAICMTYGEEKCEEDMALYHGKSFLEYLKTQQVTEKVTTCIMQAIAMSTSETSFEEGMEHTKRFLQSLGRYGNTPFLFPMYGCGEIPQCFCRLCAVFGGIYCLKRNINAIHVDTDRNMASVLIDGRPVRCKHVVSSPGNVPPNILELNISIGGKGVSINILSRGVFLATTPLGDEDLNSGGGGVNVLRLLDGTREAILLQLSHYSCTCPKGTYLFHLSTTACSNDPESDLKPFIAQVFNNKPYAPTLVFSAFFTITGQAPDPTKSAVDPSTPIVCTDAPFYELDYDLSIQNARDIFSKLYNGAEFLPRAPDPEEIVLDNEDPSALLDHNLPEDLRSQLRQLEIAVDRMDFENLPNEIKMDET